MPYLTLLRVSTLHATPLPLILHILNQPKWLLLIIFFDCFPFFVIGYRDRKGGPQCRLSRSRPKYPEPSPRVESRQTPQTFRNPEIQSIKVDFNDFHLRLHVHNLRNSPLPASPPPLFLFFFLIFLASIEAAKKTRFFHVYPKFTKLVKGDPHSTFLFYFFVPRTSYLPIFLSYYSSASSPLPPLSPNLKSSLLFFFPHSFRSWPYTFLLLFIQTHFPLLYHILLPYSYHTRLPHAPYYTILYHFTPYQRIYISMYQCKQRIYVTTHKRVPTPTIPKLYS